MSETPASAPGVVVADTADHVVPCDNLRFTCRHGETEGSCAYCAACAACDGSCGTCPYAVGAK